MPATKTKRQKKAGPWIYSGDGWFRRTFKDGSGGQHAPAHEVYPEVLGRLVDAVALNCSTKELEQVYGKEIADVVMEAKVVIKAME